MAETESIQVVDQPLPMSDHRLGAWSLQSVPLQLLLFYHQLPVVSEGLSYFDVVQTSVDLSDCLLENESLHLV